MSGGGGSLDAMNKTLKNNRNLLRRKNGFEILKENFSRKKNIRVYKYKKASKGYLKELNQTIVHNNKVARIKATIILLIVALVFGIGFYLLMNKAKPNAIAEINKNKYFKTVTYPIENKMVLKVDYFDAAQKAVETKLLYGLKHQNSESWYPTGQQFRSSVYWKDTLINEVYFYPNGDTLKYFAETYNQSINYVKIEDKKSGNYYSFYFSEGKILPNSFRIEK